MSTDTDTDTGDGADGPTVVGAESAPSSLSHSLSDWAAAFTPPDLWRTGRPPLRTSWTWARHGQHMPNDDTARMGSKIGAYSTLPFRAVLLYLDWLLERPSRFVFATVLVTAFILAIRSWL